MSQVLANTNPTKGCSWRGKKSRNFQESYQLMSCNRKAMPTSCHLSFLRFKSDFAFFKKHCSHWDFKWPCLPHIFKPGSRPLAVNLWVNEVTQALSLLGPLLDMRISKRRSGIDATLIPNRYLKLCFLSPSTCVSSNIAQLKKKKKEKGPLRLHRHCQCN
jgi:hypothetical protein